VLQNLVGMDDIKAGVLELEVVDVTLSHLGVVEIGQPAAGLIQHGSGAVDGHDPAGRDPAGQVGGQRGRAAPHVEQARPRAEVVEEIGGRVLCRPPAVRAEDGVVMAMGVDV
jgi:hypothetical protein